MRRLKNLFVFTTTVLILCLVLVLFHHERHAGPWTSYAGR